MVAHVDGLDTHRVLHYHQHTSALPHLGSANNFSISGSDDALHGCATPRKDGIRGSQPHVQAHWTDAAQPHEATAAHGCGHLEDRTVLLRKCLHGLGQPHAQDCEQVSHHPRGRRACGTLPCYPGTREVAGTQERVFESAVQPQTGRAIHGFRNGPGMCLYCQRLIGWKP